MDLCICIFHLMFFVQVSFTHLFLFLGRSIIFPICSYLDETKFSHSHCHVGIVSANSRFAILNDGFCNQTFRVPSVFVVL